MSIKEISKSLRENKSGFLVTFLALLLFWLFVSSTFDIQHIMLGAFCALLVAVFSHEMLIRKGERALPKPKVIILYLFYIGYLITEIIKSNIQVARIVLDPKMPISPGIVKFKTGLKKDLIKVTLANSITLTPGTFTIDIIGDTYYVHAITTHRPEEYARGIEEWPMLRRLREIENVSG
ncbi:MAG: Na+/H+ antiporter subunit E [Candidatus Hydrothermarchaeales archaeon]